LLTSFFSQPHIHQLNNSPSKRANRTTSIPLLPATFTRSRIYIKTPNAPLQNQPHAHATKLFLMTTIENLKTIDPFADADEGDANNAQKKGQDYIHIRIQQRNGRKTLTTIQGLPKRFDQKKILKVIKKKFACNGTIVEDTDLGEVIQLQGDQRKAIHDFLVDKQEGLEMDSKLVKVHGF
ncbi:translation initiation factor sui1, partial [Colletotrichum incanum]